MTLDCKKRSCRRWMPALVLTAALVQGLAGCALFPAGDGAGTRPWSDSMGQGLRDASPAATAEAPAKKEPFWEKYRDKRVSQINQNLNVEEPAGW